MKISAYCIRYAEFFVAKKVNICSLNILYSFMIFDIFRIFDVSKLLKTSIILNSFYLANYAI